MKQFRELRVSLTRFLVFPLTGALVSGCGGGGSGTAEVTVLKAGDLNGKYLCTGGPYSFGFLAAGKCTDNQIIQGTCQRTVSIVSEKYFDYDGAIGSSLLLNFGVIQGPDRQAYYYGKTSLGDRLVYERYLLVLREGSKTGVAVKPGSITPTSGVEYSLDTSRNLVVTSYNPKPLPSGLTYSKESGGPGDIEVTEKMCSRIQ